MDTLQAAFTTEQATVIVHDDFDQAAFHDGMQLHSGLKTLVVQSAQTLPTAPALIEDIFYSLYQPAPRLLPESELPLSTQVNHQMIEQIMGTHQWGEVREAGTIGDAFYSALSSSFVGKGVIGALNRETLKRLRDLQEAEQAAQDLLSEAQALDEVAAEKGGSERLHQQAEEARQKAKAQEAAAERLHQEIEQEIEGIEDAARYAAREALENAESTVETMIACVNSYSQGYDTFPGARKANLTIKERFALAQKVGTSETLQHIAELCGRMTRIALRCQEVKVLHPPDEVVGITSGDDLGKMLSSELGLLSDPALEWLFYKKYLEKQLQMIDMRGHERKGRGPIVFALDSSGSMSSVLGGPYSKEVWGKAVVLAILAIARKQKRDCIVYHFSATDEKGKKQLKSFTYPKGEGTPQSLIATSEFFYGGGTDFTPWMDEALKVIETSQFKEADTLIISDGLVSIPRQQEERWNRTRREKEMRSYGVLFGNQGANVLGRITDAMATLDNLTNDVKALEMLFSI